MAMYMDMIVMDTQGKTEFRTFEKCVHVGDKISFDRLFVARGEFILQADGHELERCCEIVGINLPKKRVFMFTGETAKTILLNWENYNK